MLQFPSLNPQLYVMRVISGNVYALPRYILNNGGSYSPYDNQKIDIDKLERIQDFDEDDEESDSELSQRQAVNTRPARQPINRNSNGIQIGTFAYRLR